MTWTAGFPNSWLTGPGGLFPNPYPYPYNCRPATEAAACKCWCECHRWQVQPGSVQEVDVEDRFRAYADGYGLARQPVVSHDDATPAMDVDAPLSQELEDEIKALERSCLNLPEQREEGLLNDDASDMTLVEDPDTHWLTEDGSWEFWQKDVPADGVECPDAAEWDEWLDRWSSDQDTYFQEKAEAAGLIRKGCRDNYSAEAVRRPCISVY
ncbi:hypothetical protein C8R46DRAFT_1356477 [Mycena filopes]|nr:hypothetical protein C8R46DRAFT_1356477 [Mycena filopes]